MFSMTNNVKDGAFFLREREIERERGEEKIRKYFGSTVGIDPI